MELMNTSEASRHLQASLQLCIAMGSAVEVTLTQWAIARLTFLQGNRDEAIRRLRVVVGELTRQSMLTDAALAAVHLAEILHATDRTREIPKLLAGVVQTFVDAGMLTGALAALVSLLSSLLLRPNCHCKVCCREHTPSHSRAPSHDSPATPATRRVLCRVCPEGSVA
jgi:hypothetical protein